MGQGVLIVDDHVCVRESLCWLIENKSDLEVVGQCGDGGSAVSLVRELSPDIVIMDYSLPLQDGISASKNILRVNYKVKIVLMDENPTSMSLKRSLDAGIPAYLSKRSSFEEVIQAIEVINNEQKYFSHHLSGLLVAGLVCKGDMAKDTPEALSDREVEVLRMISDGKRSEDIANSFKLGIKSIETYRSKIMKKLDLHSIAELTKYAVQAGISSPYD